MVAKRQWTKEELDRVHPLVGWAWAYRANGSWCARNEENGRRRDVWVSGAGHLVAECSIPMAMPYSIDPPVDIALAVILASKGRDSLAAMADALEVAADADHRAAAESDSHGERDDANTLDGRASGKVEAAAMVRRGTVEP
jgi:hypothetical protein